MVASLMPKNTIFILLLVPKNNAKYIIQHMQQYQVFELIRDINPAITKGMQGVILEVLDTANYIVEFVKDDGTNYEYEGEFTFDVKESDIRAIP